MYMVGRLQRWPPVQWILSESAHQQRFAFTVHALQGNDTVSNLRMTYPYFGCQDRMCDVTPLMTHIQRLKFILARHSSVTNRSTHRSNRPYDALRTGIVEFCESSNCFTLTYLDPSFTLIDIWLIFAHGNDQLSKDKDARNWCLFSTNECVHNTPVWA